MHIRVVHVFDLRFIGAGNQIEVATEADGKASELGGLIFRTLAINGDIHDILGVGKTNDRRAVETDGAGRDIQFASRPCCVGQRGGNIFVLFFKLGSGSRSFTGGITQRRSHGEIRRESGQSFGGYIKLFMGRVDLTIRAMLKRGVGPGTRLEGAYRAELSST